MEHSIQRSIRYQHHHLNCKESLENGLITNGLKINKRQAIKPVSENFLEKWNTILITSKQDLVKLLLTESLQLVDSLDKAHDEEILKINSTEVTGEKRLNINMEIIGRN